MLSKCFAIISWLPDEEPKRTNRRNKFLKLLAQLNQYFSYPIVIVAQNQKPEDLKLSYSNKIIIYNYKEALGITHARILLREKLLELNYDYNIFLDDDSNLVITEEGKQIYEKELEEHRNHICFFHGCQWRMLALSKEMLSLTNFDYIKKYESIRGEIQEDLAFAYVYKRLYPDKIFNFSMTGLKDIFEGSEKEEDSTQYSTAFINMQKKTLEIAKEQLKHEQSK